MKWLALVASLSACDPSIDFDFDLGLGGPVVGDYGAVTFSFVDGCPGGDVLFGCPNRLPPFAVGAQGRFIIGSTTGTPDDERRVARARTRSLDETILRTRREADGMLVVDALAMGLATLELVDDGEVIDSIDILVKPIVELEANDGPPELHVAGSRFPAAVSAYGKSRTLLFARLAVSPKLFGVDFDPDATAFSTASTAIAVTGTTPGEARVEFWTETSSVESSYRIVTRDEITDVAIHEVAPTPNANKVTLAATAQIAGERVHGGPICDWEIVSGGGTGASLSARAGDALSSTTLFVLYDSALVYGSGDTIVECRVNDRVIAHHTIHFAP